MTTSWTVTPTRNNQRTLGPKTITSRGHWKVSPRPTPSAVRAMPGPIRWTGLNGLGSGRMGSGASRPIGTVRSAATGSLLDATVIPLHVERLHGGGRVADVDGALDRPCDERLHLLADALVRRRAAADEQQISLADRG